MVDKTSNSQFIVHLDKWSLPPEVQASIANEIRAAALRELARTDLNIDFGVRVPNKHWVGLWLERIEKRDISRPLVGGGPVG